MAARVERLLGHLHRQPRRLAEGLDAALLAALLGDAVERDLGGLDLRLGIDRLAGIERLLDHLAADSDQLAQQRQIVDLLGEVARPDQRRAGAGELGEIGRPAALAHPLVGIEHWSQRHRARDHVAIHHAQDRLVDAGVERLVEMIGAQLELDVLDQPVVDHQGAEQRRLRLDVAGERGRVAATPHGGHESDGFGHGALVHPSAPAANRTSPPPRQTVGDKRPAPPCFAIPARLR